MAKSRRRRTGGSKIIPVKNYRDDEYIPYIYNAEKGILNAWAISSTLTDGDVRKSLRILIKNLEQTQALPKLLTSDKTISTTEDKTALFELSNPDLVEKLIIEQLKIPFKKNGPLSVEDLIGILKVINNSIGTWNVGMYAQGYLNYITDFLAKIPEHTF